MKKRQLGTNGPLLSEIGLGAWAMGGAWKFGWGKTDDAESISTIHAAIDAGVNWIDTAAVYGLGHSETIVGKALKRKRGSIFLATKCGQVWNEKGETGTDNSAKSIRGELEASLRRLGTDVVDLYQIHWPDRHTAVEETWAEMARLQEEGKTRFIGVCNFGIELLERCQSIARVQSLQPIYNLLERDIEADIIPFCRANGIGIVAYSPMQSGLLSGQFDMAKLAPDDWRIVHSEKFREPKLSFGTRVVESLRPLAVRYSKTVGQVAIQWVLMNQGVTSAIVGARRTDQVAQNVGGSGWTITGEDMHLIDEVLKSAKDPSVDSRHRKNPTP